MRECKHFHFHQPRIQQELAIIYTVAAYLLVIAKNVATFAQPSPGQTP